MYEIKCTMKISNHSIQEKRFQQLKRNIIKLLKWNKNSKPGVDPGKIRGLFRSLHKNYLIKQTSSQKLILQNEPLKTIP